ncbi:hypothetical protein [Mesorhizobium dulcispinae]|uniref:hypothetical protein n=1 Tax=Mesorhizobium dulcispinae TaxID=3072316 RepID=UPI002A24A23E|nr:hypothetical protein [Mesorhizobium sp. VK23D]MDX8517400.1 hypothetical protein [Mesorhizobium sp. VK23D]
MRIDQASSRLAGSRWAVSKWAGRASVTLGALMLLGGCMTSGRDQTSAIDRWLTTADANAVVNAMAAKGLIPETIDCRFADTTPAQLAYVSKFTWKRAPANTRYHWEVGDPTYLASKEVRANRVGLRRVFAKVVRDPASGRKVGCSVWTS